MPILIFLLRLISKLPLTALYLLSSVIAWCLEHLFAYRKSIVLANLARSFPGKTDDERRAIAHRYYVHLSDVIVETIKLASMSQKDLLQRVHFDQPELLADLTAQGKNVVVMMGHSGNWEWAGCATSAVQKTQVLPVYRKVKEPAFNQFFYSIRSRFGAQPVLDKEAFPTLSRAPKPQIVAMLADQTPGGKKGLWLPFLHQNTPFFRGTEVLVRRLGHVVVFAQVRKVSRGKYSIHFEMADQSDTREHAILLQYAAFLEREIADQPFNWLWSHKRWKHKPAADAVWIHSLNQA